MVLIVLADTTTTSACMGSGSLADGVRISTGPTNWETTVVVLLDLRTEREKAAVEVGAVDQAETEVYLSLRMPKERCPQPDSGAMGLRCLLSIEVWIAGIGHILD